MIAHPFVISLRTFDCAPQKKANKKTFISSAVTQVLGGSRIFKNLRAAVKEVVVYFEDPDYWLSG